MHDVEQSVATAIDTSANQDRVVRLTWSQDAEDALLAECDDHADAGAEHEFWGTSETTRWRVHLVREPGAVSETRARALVAECVDVDDGTGDLGIIVREALRADPATTAAGIREIVREAREDARIEREREVQS